MTTATLVTHGRTVDTETARPRRSLEELVDRLIETLFPTETAEASVTRSIHEARRLRQADDIDGGLAVLAGVDTVEATPREIRWAFSEWRDLVRRRFGDRAAMVYIQGEGRAAVLVPHGDGLLEVATVLGMRWKPGKLVSERSLRGLQPLKRACLAPMPGERRGAALVRTLVAPRTEGMLPLLVGHAPGLGPSLLEPGAPPRSLLAGPANALHLTTQGLPPTPIGGGQPMPDFTTEPAPDLI
ncbi:MAG: hypothetical protein OYI31_06500 [Chloroflexota bacterium]|nr:hypothetical protein [Chloroflexota bacterium]MDE2942358.1 hypothetical protein [Chloroflexota bacterium]MDE3268081.1 hypothetical protein [Chloroflexota bacterium]